MLFTLVPAHSQLFAIEEPRRGWDFEREGESDLKWINDGSKSRGFRIYFEDVCRMHFVGFWLHIQEGNCRCLMLAYLRWFYGIEMKNQLGTAFQ